MTITEALAEIKTLNKRIAKKRDFIGQNLVRQNAVRDPFDSEGGTRQKLTQEIQAVVDMERRIVDLRRCIAHANATTEINVAGVTKTVADWLTWRREVAPGRSAWLNDMQKRIVANRQNAQKQGLQTRNADEMSNAALLDLLVNIDEGALQNEIENIEQVFGELDGQLSMLNATVAVEV